MWAYLVPSPFIIHKILENSDQRKPFFIIQPTWLGILEEKKLFGKKFSISTLKCSSWYAANVSGRWLAFFKTESRENICHVSYWICPRSLCWQQNFRKIIDYAILFGEFKKEEDLSQKGFMAGHKLLDNCGWRKAYLHVCECYTLLLHILNYCYTLLNIVIHCGWRKGYLYVCNTVLLHIFAHCCTILHIVTPFLDIFAHCYTLWVAEGVFVCV